MGRADEKQVASVIERIRGSDIPARYAAVKEAASLGAEAVVPLGGVYGGSDRAAAKAAGLALRDIAYRARPESGEGRAVAEQLVKLAGEGQPLKTRSLALHLLGFVGTGESVPAVARALDDPQLREDARMALEQIPGRAAENALRQALRRVPEDFRPAIEQSLRNRSRE